MSKEALRQPTLIDMVRHLSARFGVSVQTTEVLRFMTALNDLAQDAFRSGVNAAMQAQPTHQPPTQET